MIAGVRRSIWIASTALLALALWLVSGLVAPGARQASESPAPAALDAAPAAPAVPTSPARVASREALPVAPTAAPSAGSASTPAPIETAVAPVVPTTDPEEARLDSRLVADLRILEDDAARLAESRGLVDPAILDAAQRAAAPASNAARDDARRTVLADATLVEHFVQDAYQGTEFPIGYPAEERTRDAAVSYVRGLTPELRKDLLEIVLATQADAPAPIGPRFAPLESGFVWEGAIAQ